MYALEIDMEFWEIYYKESKGTEQVMHMEVQSLQLSTTLNDYLESQQSQETVELNRGQIKTEWTGLLVSAPVSQGFGMCHSHTSNKKK